MAENIKLVDVTKCTGCRACMVACKNWNDLPAEREDFNGTYQSNGCVSAYTWNNITFNEQLTADGNFEWLFRYQTCLHCVYAPCEKSCPEDAISHTEFGSVVIDSDKCVGCGYCVQACPFDVVQLAAYQDKRGKEYKIAQKCHQCTNRLEEGLKPACVTACPTEALVYGDKEELLAATKERLEIVKERFPNANIYSPQGLNGSNTVYLLADKPSVYGLPDDPQAPLSQVVWKDYAQPIGKMMFGAATMAVIGAVISNAVTKRNDSEKGDHDYE